MVSCLAEVHVERGRHRDCQIEVTVITPKKLSFRATVITMTPRVVGLKSTKMILPKDRISILINLRNEIELLGTAIWTLDSSHNGEIMYQTGVQIEAIILPNKKAYELSDRAQAVEEILCECTANGFTATALNQSSHEQAWHQVSMP